MPEVQVMGNLALAGFNDIFNVGKINSNGECVVELALSELHAPEFHPFQVNDDLSMKRLVKSVKQYGIREPGLVRPHENGYELIVGNRRKHACELAGILTMPVIIREMDDDSAAIAMVDSNLEQREKLLFSEKAWAYRIKLEALDHNGIKSNMLSVDVLVDQTGESKTQIFRLIRLTELVPALLDKVDTRGIAFNPAVELSYLSRREQLSVADAIAKYEVKPSLAQAIRLKKMKQSGTLTIEAIDKILAEDKKTQQDEARSVLSFRKFFPPEYSPKQMYDVIADLLRGWQAKQVRT